MDKPPSPEYPLYKLSFSVKNTAFISIGCYFIISVIFSSCRATKDMSIAVLEPAPVSIPENMQRVGIIDQTLPNDKSKILDNLDKILTIEGKNLDKDGANAAVLGLFNQLPATGRFSEVKIIEDSTLRSPGMGIFPAPIPWEIVQQLCFENNVDVLFVLSFYDTDTKVAYQAIPVQINTPLNLKIPGLEHQATVTTLIKTGWRIYDPEKKVLRDEHIAVQQIGHTGRGIDPVVALQGIVGRKEAVMDISGRLGRDYCYRMSPYYVRVWRNCFVRGTNNFRIAMRRAETGNWEGAAELWLKETENPKRRVAGRAAYNMAIISEINGDLDAAVKWASRSYSDYRIKAARNYLIILQNRIERKRLAEYEF